MFMALFERLTRRKNLVRKDEDTNKFSRCLTTFNLITLGVGSTLGVGIYVLTGSVARNQAGPSVVLSFAIAGISSALSGVCYAELGGRVPRAGSAYVYCYVTVGEFMAFIIGWNLVLEYVIGTASVARGYSGYLDNMFNDSMSNFFREWFPLDVPFLSPYPDFCAFFITLFLAFILAYGVQESALFSTVFTGLNVCVVVLVTVMGFVNSDVHNWSIPKDEVPPNAGNGGFFPFGISGTLAGAATCFYGFVGFDTIATSGEETKNPQRSIPLAICVSLFLVFLAYLGISSGLTMMVPYYAQDVTAPIPGAFRAAGWPSIASIVTFGALFGLSTSLMGSMFPLPRILYAMSSDGLIHRWLSVIHPKYKTPYRATLFAGTFAGFMAMFFEISTLVDMMSIGTLMAYTLVDICVIILRFEFVPGTQGDKQELHVAPSPTSETMEDETEELFNPFQKSKSSTFPSKKHVVPTTTSSRITVALVLLYTLLVCILVELLLSVYPLSSTIIYSIFGTVALILLTLALISLMPRARLPDENCSGFRVPWVPLIPALGIFFNIYLILKLSHTTWIRFSVWMFIGLSMYLTYGLKNSSEEICPRQFKYKSVSTTSH